MARDQFEIRENFLHYFPSHIPDQPCRKIFLPLSFKLQVGQFLYQVFRRDCIMFHSGLFAGQDTGLQHVLAAGEDASKVNIDSVQANQMQLEPAQPFDFYV